MLTSQQEVIAFLSTPEAYALPADSVIERIETHISLVFLAGARVYKLKRAVLYDYVDFSTLDARQRACEAEVRLNRRSAPSLYLGVRAVTRGANGRLSLGGAGEPVEWLVEMVRFDQSRVFDQLATQHQLPIELMGPLADAIGEFHANAERRTDHGGRDGMSWVVEGNANAFVRLLTDPNRIIAECLTETTRRELERHAMLLDDRRATGFVRECHGDLHLRNICLIDGVPTLFDCVEFNDEISCVDVWYDVAFLLMDLWRRDLCAHANAVFNRYLTKSGDIGGLPLLPLFLSCRAAIRAKTSVTAAAMRTSSRPADELRIATTEYLTLAAGMLHGPHVRLIAIGGLSGSGKSELARNLAPGIGAAPGGVILQSDAIRKERLGVGSVARLPMDAYAHDVTRAVYQTLAERAGAVLNAGYSVIADATYVDPHERTAIAAVAAEAGVPFTGIWLDAPSDVLSERVATRAAAATDVSDATVAVLRRQLTTDPGPVSWHQVDTSRDIEAVLAEAEQLIE
jgi:aminoglycoside phosphotransferase family enzyme/predicted kinase